MEHFAVLEQCTLESEFYALCVCMALAKNTQPIHCAALAAQCSTLDGLAAILLGLPACSKVNSMATAACVRPCNELSLGVMPVRPCRLLAAA